jgi:hypothetical protein
MTTNDEKFNAALRDPDSKLHAIKITPEKQERLARICDEMIDELVKRTEGPAEAYMVLTFMLSALEETKGFKAGKLIQPGKQSHG